MNETETIDKKENNQQCAWCNCLISCGQKISKPLEKESEFSHGICLDCAKEKFPPTAPLTN